MEAGVHAVIQLALHQRERTSLRRVRKALRIIGNKHNLKDGEINVMMNQLPHLLGNWDQLKEDYRRVLSEYALHHYQEMALNSCHAVRWIAKGEIYKIAARTIGIGWRVRKYGLFSSRVLIFAGRKTILLCRKLASGLLGMMKRMNFCKTPALDQVFSICKIDTNIIENYIEQIPATPDTSIVFNIPGRDSFACALIGLDLLPSGGKLYFIEANMSPGHYVARHRCFPEGDTLCWHLIRYAQQMKFGRICFCPTARQKHFDGKLETYWQRIAESNNILLEIIDDAYLGSPYKRRSNDQIKYDQPGCLYVNAYYQDTAFCNMISRKGHLEGLINRHNAKCGQEKRIPVPILYDKREPNRIKQGDGKYPNVIIKNKNIDQAKGIRLYKTEILPEVSDDGECIISEYVAPDTIRKEIDGGVQEFVYLYRTYLIISPAGAVYAGARKDISGTPLPERCEKGEISNIAPYITNLTTAGDYCVSHSMGEDRQCEKATMDIGNLIYDWFARKYAI